MRDGYIKLHRSIQAHWLWTKSPFCQPAAWIDLLLMAEWKTAKHERGSIWTTYRFLATRWGWHRNAVCRFLSNLEQDGMVRIKRDTKRDTSGTTIFIEDYNKYPRKNGTPNGTPPGHQTGHDLGHQTGHQKTDDFHSETGKTQKEKRDTKRDTFWDTKRDYKNTYIEEENKEYTDATENFRWDAAAQDWAGINQGDMDAWAEAYPHVALEREMSRAAQWVIANPAKAQKSNWRRFMTNWFSRAEDRAPKNYVPPPAAHRWTQAELEWLEGSDDEDARAADTGDRGGAGDAVDGGVVETGGGYMPEFLKGLGDESGASGRGV